MPNFEDGTVNFDFQSARIIETFAIGQILATKYKVISLLGSGGMGKVYRVQQIFLKIELALKVLDGKQHLNESQMRRFTVEAKAAYSLNHPALVKVHDFGLLENGQPYLVMDLVAGNTLADHLKEFGPMAVKQACEVFVQAAEGLYYAHQQSVIHRDIKPSNVMLLTGGTGGPCTVKIVDFGIAKIVGEDVGEVQALTRTGEVFGSPFYMSPEQCSGELVDHRTDIYSLGCTFFETLTGTPPHVGVNALRTMMLHKNESAPTLRDASLGADFPESLERIIQQMLEKSPHERYENLMVVAREIDEVIHGSENEKNSKGNQKLKSGKTSGAKKSNAHNAQGKAEPKPKIISIAVSLAILLLVTVTATTIFYSTETSRTKNENASATPPESEEARKAKIRGENLITQSALGINNTTYENQQKARISYSRAMPIEMKLVTDGGIKKRQINFPELAIGQVQIDHEQAKNIEARGNVEVPAEGHLQLVMGGVFAIAFETPTVINKVAPDIFDGLAIESPDTLLDSQSSGLDRESNNTRNMTEILSSASKWTKLKEIVINSCVLNKSAVQEIAKVKHLDQLMILNVRGSEIELANQPFMRKLSILKLERLAAADILKTISGSTTLKTLCLEKTDMNKKGLAETDFKELSKCPNLDALTIVQNKITDSQINNLVHMKNLRSISLIDVPIVSRQLQNLLKSSSLKNLWLVGTSSRCLQTSPVEDSRLKVAKYPRTNVFDQLRQ